MFKIALQDLRTSVRSEQGIGPSGLRASPRLNAVWSVKGPKDTYQHLLYIQYSTEVQSPKLHLQNQPQTPTRTNPPQILLYLPGKAPTIFEQGRPFSGTASRSNLVTGTLVGQKTHPARVKYASFFSAVDLDPPLPPLPLQRSLNCYTQCRPGGWVISDNDQEGYLVDYQ